MFISLKNLACQPKPWRRLVEAMGVEPMSATPYDLSATCLSLEYTHRVPSKAKLHTRAGFVIQFGYKTKNTDQIALSLLYELDQLIEKPTNKFV